jgi:diguanylate cyclase (GGDEF)-like protein
MGALLRGELQHYRTETPCLHKDGKEFWGDLSVSVLHGDDGAPAFVVGVLLDVSDWKRMTQQLHASNEQLAMQLFENRKLQERLSDLAVRDPLTGLFNRRFMEETLERELAQATREGTPLSLVIMDIDHFKQLNDTYGHPAGDYALKALTRLLRVRMRRGDVACRYGGEEFVAILPGATIATAVARADSWRRAFQDLHLEFEGRMIRSTLSAGIAEFPRHGRSGQELLFQADSALYQAKRSGRNRVSILP